MKKNYIIAILIVLVAILLVAVMGLIVFNKKDDVEVKNENINKIVAENKNLNTNKTAEEEVIEVDDGLEIKGDKIYKDDELLFNNVSNVEEVRSGPDNDTIHFKVKSPDKDSKYCADLSTEVTDVSEYADKDTPREAPWDYAKIAHAYTIDGCGFFQYTGGYLKTTDYFVYIKIDKDNNTEVVVEDMDQQKLFSESIDYSLIEKFDEQTYAGSISEFTDDEGNRYLYNQDDATPEKNKSVVGFNSLVVGIDYEAKKLLGTHFFAEDFYNMGPFYQFKSNPDSSIVVVIFAYEIMYQPVALFDVSEDNLEIVSLLDYEINAPMFDDYDLIEWGGDGVTLNKQAYEDIEIEDLYEQVTEAGGEDALAEKLNNELPKYSDVHCEFGMLTGCYGLLGIQPYKYTPGGEVIDVLND